MLTHNTISKSASEVEEYANEMVFRLCFAVGYQRTIKNISIGKLAILSGVSAETIKKIEEYKLTPNIRTLICIMRALGFTLNVDNLDDC